MTLVLVLVYDQFVVVPIGQAPSRPQAAQAAASAQARGRRTASRSRQGHPLAGARGLAARSHRHAAALRLDQPDRRAARRPLPEAVSRDDGGQLAAGGTAAPARGRERLLRGRRLDRAELSGLPDEQTPWTQVSKGPLTDANPLELTYSSPAGLVFHREIKVDPQYLFTVTDTVQNTSAAPVSIEPYGSVQRRGVPPALGQIAMEGAIGDVRSRPPGGEVPRLEEEVRDRQRLQGLRVDRRLAGHHRQVLDDGVRTATDRSHHRQVPGDAAERRRRLRGQLRRRAAHAGAGRDDHRDHPRLRRRQGGEDAATPTTSSSASPASTRRSTGAGSRCFPSRSSSCWTSTPAGSPPSGSASAGRSWR